MITNGKPDYFTSILVSISQLINVVIFNGYPDEMISARAYRTNTVFWNCTKIFLDYIYGLLGQEDHCYSCYLWELSRKDSPNDY